MAKIRGGFFDLYGTLLGYGDIDSSWADWLRCPATSAPDEPKTSFCGAFSFAQLCFAVAARQLVAGELSGDSEFVSAGDAEQLEDGVFYGLNLVRIIEATGVATGCA